MLLNKINESKKILEKDNNYDNNNNFELHAIKIQ